MDIRPVVKSLAPGASGIEREVPATAARPVSATPSAAAVAGTRGETAPANAADTDVGRAVERINAALPPSSQGIEFSIDEDSERVIVKVVDRETREVLRQMPSQEALDLARALDRGQGMLIKLEA